MFRLQVKLNASIDNERPMINPVTKEITMLLENDKCIFMAFMDNRYFLTTLFTFICIIMSFIQTMIETD